MWLAYRTRRGDHFAVVRFTGVVAWFHTTPHWDLAPGALYELPEGEPRGGDAHHWVAVAPGDAIEIAAGGASVVVRAIAARDADSALTMVLS